MMYCTIVAHSWTLPISGILKLPLNLGEKLCELGEILFLLSLSCKYIITDTFTYISVQWKLIEVKVKSERILETLLI